ncbi:MAG: P22 coat protein - protein 5 domain protein [Clostridia bacterium]|nr:P22 coat protein - protein 5 domain protein [Clostridia bacterium]
MALTNFIPTVWSESLYSELDKKYIAVRNCNRDFEGDIRAKGNTVKICGVGDISVFDYTRNTDMSSPETLSDSVRTLTIDQAKGFNFQIDDVDAAQQTPKVMQEAMRKAASALANAADNYVFGLYESADENNVIVNDSATKDNIIDTIISARTKLFANNVYDADDIVIEVTPEVAELILKAKISLSTDNGEALEAGCIGSVCGTKIYVSNNVKKVDGHHKCLARTKRAIAFAQQLSEIDAYRPEKRFADAVKGLHLYGAKIVYPSELFVLDVTVA